MGRSDPPAARVFRIGRDSRGHWVVQDQQGLRGGLFVDRGEAVRFAMSESGNCPYAVVVVPGVMELDMRPAGADHVATASALKRTV
jgi:hypothetical protein